MSQTSRKLYDDEAWLSDHAALTRRLFSHPRIDVPTEGNLPILKASRLPRRPSAEPPSAQAIKLEP